MEQSAHGGSGIAVSGSTDVVLSNLVEQWTWQYWINNSISEVFSNLHNSRIERCLHGLERHFFLFRSCLPVSAVLITIITTHHYHAHVHKHIADLDPVRSPYNIFFTMS